MATSSRRRGSSGSAWVTSGTAASS
jgi:hypothetical protein